jgi:hypothetical protein
MSPQTIVEFTDVRGHAVARESRYTSEDFGPIKDRTEWMPVYVYRYAWNRDYTALERSREFSVGYDLKTGETVPF